MSKEFLFSVQATYQYKIVANTEQEARKILEDEGGLSIEGELYIDPDNYSNAYLENVRENKNGSM